MRRLLVLVALFLSLPAQAATIDWAEVGNPNNLPDTPSTNCRGANCGSVDHAYFISKYETTNAQYAEFLNAKASADPLDLYDAGMGGDWTFGGITRSGVSGSYTYTVRTGFADKPVTYVTFYDSLRFSNWLNNGQGSGDTETGAYTLLGGTATPSNGLTVTRNPGAITFLPSENEWYKAAYYSPGGVYFDYPTGTDSMTRCEQPADDTGNTANCRRPPTPWPEDVGAYGLSGSPYGTFDQGGNAWEWNQDIVVIASDPVRFYRGMRGGSWYVDASYSASSYAGASGPTFHSNESGFRVAMIPEPGTALLVMTGVLGLAASRRRRAN